MDGSNSVFTLPTQSANDILLYLGQVVHRHFVSSVYSKTISQSIKVFFDVVKAGVHVPNLTCRGQTVVDIYWLQFIWSFYGLKLLE